eukprot:jgi/Hompol1/31/HPOL_003835-RA
MVQRAKFIERINEQRNRIEADDILGKLSAKQIREREADLELQLTSFDATLSEKMQSFRRRQQRQMQDEGMPGFRVTDDPDEIAAQLWSLSPFLLKDPDPNSAASDSYFDEMA